MRFLRFSLFLIIFTLLSTGLFTEVAHGDSNVIYQGLGWRGNAFGGEVNQDNVTGTFPNQIVSMAYRVQSDTVAMDVIHGFNATDFGYHVQVDIQVDYDTLSYVILTTPDAGDNTSLVEFSSGTDVGDIGWNTSFTHVANNVFLVGQKLSSVTTSDVASQDDWGSLGVNSCTDYVTLSENVFHSFVFQFKNDSGSEYAYEMFIDNFYWCTFLITTANGPNQWLLGNVDDLGAGSGTGNIIVSYRGFQAIVGRHSLSLDLAGLSTGLGEGDNPTGITIQAFNIQDEITQNHVVGQIVRFQALLLNITDPFSVGDIRLDNFPLIISRNSIDLTTSITNDTGWASFFTTPAGNVGDNLVYTVRFDGSSGHNLSSTSSTIQISLIAVGASSFQSTALSPLTARDIDERPRIIFVHDEFIKFRVRLTDESGNGIPDQPIVFHIDKNSTGTFIVHQIADTNSVGVATSQFSRIDSTFVGDTLVQARYQGDLQFQAANSTVITFTVISTVGQLDLSINVEPNPVNPGVNYRLFGNLEIIQPDGFRQSLVDENIQVFRADFADGWEFLESDRTDLMGLFEISLQRAEAAGSLTIVFRANATVNSLNVLSDNVTLTINPISILEDDLDPGDINLDDFLPDIEDIDFGFGTNGGNGILLWFVAFMMFAFGGVFAMNRTFPEAMSSQLVIGWFVMMFGSWTGIAFGLQWITLNFVILLLAPIALIGGIVMLRIFRGGGTT